MINIERLIRPHLRKLVPYSSARDEYNGRNGVFLDANENSFGSSAGKGYNRYPDPYQNQVKKLLSSEKKIPVKNIFLGNGSDEIIDLVIRLFCGPGKDKIIIAPPTYGMYEVSAGINEIDVIRIPLDGNFQVNVNGILYAGRKQHAKVLFLCTPNNPTGNNLKRPSVLKLINAFEGIILIDEAYSDFTTSSYLNQLRNHPNLIIMQTFSKAWGMAGLRLGVAYADEKIIGYLNKIKPPYNVNQATQLLAEKALLNKGIKDGFVKKVISERIKLEKNLNRLKIVEKVYPSDANFYLVKFKDSAGVFRYLLENLIIVRDRSNIEQCGNSLRITVGTPGENKALIHCLLLFESHLK